MKIEPPPAPKVPDPYTKKGLTPGVAPADSSSESRSPGGEGAPDPRQQAGPRPRQSALSHTEPGGRRVPDDELWEHIAKAMVFYARHERLNGRTVPLDLLGLAVVASSRIGAHDLRRAVHAEVVGSELLTKRETALALAVSVRTVERLITAGELVAVRSGRAVRVSRRDLAAFVARRRGSFRDHVTEKTA